MHWCSYLMFGLPCSTCPRCPQVWYGTPRSSGLKTICLFRWNSIDFLCKCLLLLWHCQRSDWSVRCMLGSLPIGVSILMMKIFQQKDDKSIINIYSICLTDDCKIIILKSDSYNYTALLFLCKIYHSEYWQCTSCEWNLEWKPAKGC